MKTLLSRSSTSLKVTFEQLKLAEKMNFDSIMNMNIEFNIALRFFRPFDFFKDIRAFIIDKDQSPQWQTNKLEKVTPEIISYFFLAKLSCI
ncbi:enoyl-CoA hydratase/isomerase family protein [Candidatus Coxiella mudrowiae]|uniref:enoyl-CoA hydratase/isomerase family protein n=1 Tax=Candidatus Coxiella mudrowiae TaxID=2054173 RepID=UPI001FD0D431|nr:enoyl-CoA hydratase/isomerase family protein [Candidatus Coxiella mudrowiae]